MSKWKQLEFSFEPTKRCTKCREHKSLNLFNKSKTKSYGRQSYCRECNKAASSKWYKDNIDHAKVSGSIYYKNNAKKINAKNTAWQKANPDKVKVYSANWYSKNKEASSIRSAEYHSRPEVRARNNDRHKYRVANDPIYALRDKMRRATSRMRDLVTNPSSVPSSSKTDVAIMNKHLDHLFYDRYGQDAELDHNKLHLDHRIPLAGLNVDLNNQEHIEVLSHYTNFEWLTESDNLAKSNKVVELKFATPEQLAFLAKYNIGGLGGK